MIRSFFHLRSRSLLRGNVLVLSSLAAAFRLSRFPLNQASPTMLLPILFGILGAIDTFRCLRPRWSWYHGAVTISLCMEAMALIMILFLAIYPLLIHIG